MATSANNPWADQRSSYDDQTAPNNLAHQEVVAAHNPWHLNEQSGAHQDTATFTSQPDPWADAQHADGYRSPQGPPPGVQNPAPKLPEETARFVPESERSEQREALEQFEMSHNAQQTPDERNLELLTQEFPKIDSALVAAIYGDSRDVATSRELLTELSNQI